MGARGWAFLQQIDYSYMVVEYILFYFASVLLINQEFVIIVFCSASLKGFLPHIDLILTKDIFLY